jgi:hypothetical protein
VQNANESFGVADAVPGTWEEIAGPLRPIRVLRPLIGFPFRQNKGLNDKSQFLGATHQPCSFHAWGYQGSLILNGCRSSLAEPGDCGLPDNICPSARVGIRMTSARSPTNALSFSPLLHPVRIPMYRGRGLPFILSTVLNALRQRRSRLGPSILQILRVMIQRINE